MKQIRYKTYSLSTGQFKALGLAAVLLLVLLTTQVLAASDVFVSTTGNDTTGDGTAEAPYLTIQKGVDEVDADGTVNITAGTYTEQVVIAKNVTLQGADSSTTILNSPASPSVGSGGTIKAIIEINGVTASVTDLTIQGELTSESNLAGIHAHSGAEVDVSDNVIQNIKNADTSQDATSKVYEFENIGVLLSDSDTSATISENTFTGYSHSDVDQVGIKLETLAGAEISGNTFSNYIYTGTFARRVSAAIMAWDAANDGDVTIESNTFTNNHLAIGIGSTEGVEVTDNTITIDTASYSSAVPNQGIWINAETSHTTCAEGSSRGEGCSSEVTISGNTFTGGGAGYGVSVGGRGLTGRTPSNSTADVSEDNTFSNWGSGIFNDRSSPSGSVTVSENGFSGNANYAIENTQTTLITATENWFGDASGPSGEATGTGDAISANVSFSPWYVDVERTTLSNELTPSFNVTATVARGEGTISPTSQAVEEGNDGTITITPDEGFTIARILDNEVSVTVGGTYTITNVTEAHDIQVLFLDSDEGLLGTTTALDATTDTAVITDTFSGTGTIDTDDSTSSKLDFADILSGTSATLTGTITMTKDTTLGTAQVTIPESAIITGPGGWNGLMKALRHSTSTSTSLPVSEDKVASVSTAIDLGLSGQSMTLSRAARIFFPGDVGKTAGYSTDSLAFTEITSTCSEDSQTAGDALGAGADCKIEVDSDVIVWTKHFTEFITFEETDPEAPDPPSASPTAGDFNDDVTVTLTPVAEADSTTYTLDGTDPDSESTAYSDPFTVSGDDGETVTMKARSFNDVGAGDILVEAYVFDTTDPSVDSYTLEGSAASLSFNPNSATVDIVINTDEDVQYNRIYICTVDDETCNDGSAVKWFTTTSSYESTVTKTWDGEDSGETIVADGEYKIKVRIEDEATNLTETDLSPYTITVDTVAPDAPTVDAVTTPTENSTQTITGTKEANTSILQDSVEVVALDELTTWSIEVSLITGSNSFDFSASDAAGNESDTATATIEREEDDSGDGPGGGSPVVLFSGGGYISAYDETPPSNVSVTINQDAEVTTNPNVVLRIQASDASGRIEVQISNSPDFTDAVWEERVFERVWVLTPGPGEKTVYAKFRDAAGNLTEVVSDAITLDVPSLVEPEVIPVVTPDTTPVEPVVINVPEVSPEDPDYVFSSNLEVDSEDEAVTQLQWRLTSEGIYDGPITGYFGPLTEGAVRQYQEDNDLDITGQLGLDTRLSLNGVIPAPVIVEVPTEPEVVEPVEIAEVDEEEPEEGETAVASIGILDRVGQFQAAVVNVFKGFFNFLKNIF